MIERNMNEFSIQFIGVNNEAHNGGGEVASNNLQNKNHKSLPPPPHFLPEIKLIVR
jgi:hypothetical protein